MNQINTANLFLGLIGTLVLVFLIIHLLRRHVRLGCQHCNRIRCNCNRSDSYIIRSDANWEQRVNQYNACGM